MEYSSKLFENAVSQFCKLPSIGHKTAARLVFHLLQKAPNDIETLAHSLLELKEKICYCARCANISDSPECAICTNPSRQHNIICVVQTIRDVMAIEHTQRYNGCYHVLGGLISPLDGVSPDQLRIAELISRVEGSTVDEIIFALAANMQGDTTIFYIQQQLAGCFTGKLTTMSRGLSFGGSLEFTDENTLSHALSRRQPIDSYVVK